MTKGELKQIYYLNKELKMWQEELNHLECQSLAKGQQLGFTSGGNGTSDKVADLATKKADIRTIIEGKLKEIQYQRALIMEYIDGIDDSMMRQIVYLRCVSCMTWKEVADEIGGGNTASSTRKAYQRIFEKNGEK